jgi:hypothetical protein
LLLQALAEELPAGTIRYSSKIVSIEEDGRVKVLQQADGSVLRAKVNGMPRPKPSLQVFGTLTKSYSACSGADWMRWDQLRGGEMAGPREAVLLRAHGGAGPRALSRRPRLRAQVPAIHRERLPLWHATLQRNRHLLVLHVGSFRKRSVVSCKVE